MRIGMLTTSFPRDDRDIAGIFVLGFARALANTGHVIDVLAPEPRDKTPPPSWPAVRVEHVSYLRPRTLQRTFYGDGVPDNLARDPLAWLGLGPFSCALLHKAYQCAHRWDALISHWALPCALAAGCVRRGRPHIAVFHSADVHALSSPAPSRPAREPDRTAASVPFGSSATTSAKTVPCPVAARSKRVTPHGGLADGRRAPTKSRDSDRAQRVATYRLTRFSVLCTRQAGAIERRRRARYAPSPHATGRSLDRGRWSGTRARWGSRISPAQGACRPLLRCIVDGHGKDRVVAVTAADVFVLPRVLPDTRTLYAAKAHPPHCSKPCRSDCRVIASAVGARHRSATVTGPHSRRGCRTARSSPKRSRSALEAADASSRTSAHRRCECRATPEFAERQPLE